MQAYLSQLQQVSLHAERALEQNRLECERANSNLESELLTRIAIPIDRAANQFISTSCPSTLCLANRSIERASEPPETSELECKFALATRKQAARASELGESKYKEFRLPVSQFRALRQARGTADCGTSDLPTYKFRSDAAAAAAAALTETAAGVKVYQYN